MTKALLLGEIKHRISDHPQHIRVSQRAEQRVASEPRVQGHGQCQAAAVVVLFFYGDQGLEVLENEFARGLVAHGCVEFGVVEAANEPGADEDVAERDALPVLIVYLDFDK